MSDRFISDEDVQRVREASDIVAVVGEHAPVKQRGRDFWCCCPLHHEKTPSFKIDPALQLWHCFGCGEGGDVFAFVMKVEDLTFPEAVRKLIGTGVGVGFWPERTWKSTDTTTTRFSYLAEREFERTITITRSSRVQPNTEAASFYQFLVDHFADIWNGRTQPPL